MNVAVLLIVCYIPVSYVNAQENGVHVVVIDAGHGGKDPGNLGTGRYKKTEKDIALAVALKLGAIIGERHPELKVIYTRDDDTFVPLKKRAGIANKANADLFISIHCNAATNKAAYGTETYVMGMHKNKANLEVAKRENAVILMEDNYKVDYEGFDPNSDESYIAFTLMQDAFLEHSLVFATGVQESFRQNGRRDRTVKQAGYLVLYYTTMASVLAEIGFLTNKEEEDYLMDEKNREKVATAIADAFDNYDQLIVEENQSISKDKHTDTIKDHNVALDEDSTAVIYKVQLVASVQRKDLLPENFNGLDPVGEYQDGGTYKYTYSGAPDLEKARKLLIEARDAGYKDAFIVAFRSGKRISLSDAWKYRKNR